MANKLQEMKRRLLEQQLSKDKSAISLSLVQERPSIKQSPLIFQKEAETQKKVQEIESSRVAETQKVSPTIESNAKENVPQQEVDCRQEKKIIQDKNDQKAPVQLQQKKSNEHSIEKAQSKQEMQKEGENQQNQPLMAKAVQDGANLQLHDKAYNISCSVDEQVKAAVVHESIGKSNIQEQQSKQEKKMRKIVLKELNAINEGVKNLKSALKGLQILTEKMKKNPILRQKLKFYLQQLNSFRDDQDPCE